MKTRLYLDHAATAPTLAPVQTAMVEAMTRWANPSSPHTEGRAARAALEEARARIKAALEWPHEIIFTSGASEAIAIALRGSTHDVILHSAVEHDAVRRLAGDAYVLPVDANGLLPPGAIVGRLGALKAKRPLVAIQAANSETGVMQALDGVAETVRRAGGLLFVDAAQAAAKVTLPDADMIAVAAHKFGGPPGTGALLVRDLGMLRPVGGQEQGYRPGTENMPGVIGMMTALEQPRAWLARAQDLRAHLDAAIEAAGGHVIAKAAPRIATIASYRMPGVAASAQLIQFDLAGIAVSAGSACSSGTLKTSPVLAAMGLEAQAAGEVVRVSIGAETSRADIYRFLDVWKQIAASARSRAA